MSSRPRYVFDTNTLVSALLFEHSKPGQAFHQALQCGEILVSASTLEELVEVLQREMFERYMTVPKREEFVEAFESKEQRAHIWFWIFPAERIQRRSRLIAKARCGFRPCLSQKDKGGRRVDCPP